MEFIDFFHSFLTRIMLGLLSQVEQK